MKKYIPLSENAIIKRLDLISTVAYDLTNLKPYMIQLKSIVNLTDEEFKTIKDAINILNNKSDILEELLEDENNIFFNSNNK